MNYFLSKYNILLSDQSKKNEAKIRVWGKLHLKARQIQIIINYKKVYTVLYEYDASNPHLAQYVFLM